MANSPYITPAQVDEKVQAALSKGISASAKGFKLFTNPAAKDAFFNGTPPAEDTPFIYTDVGESKAEFYQRASDNTTQVLKEEALSPSDKSTNGVKSNETGLVSGKQVYDFTAPFKQASVVSFNSGHLEINTVNRTIGTSGRIFVAGNGYFADVTTTQDATAWDTAPSNNQLYYIFFNLSTMVFRLVNFAVRANYSPETHLFIGFFINNKTYINGMYKLDGVVYNGSLPRDANDLRSYILNGSDVVVGSSLYNYTQNLFNNETYVPGYYSENGTSYVASTQYWTTDYIPVTPGQEYKRKGITNSLFVYAYNANKTSVVVQNGKVYFQSTTGSVGIEAGPIPENVAFIKIVFAPSDLNKAMFTLKDVDNSTYFPYRLVKEKSLPVVSQNLSIQKDLGNVFFQPLNTDYSHIIFYGQSLSMGWESTEALSTTPVPGTYMIGDRVWINQGNDGSIALNPLVASVSPNCGESPAVASVHSLKKLLDRQIPNNTVELISTNCGDGGRSIERLSKESTNGTNYYSTFFETAVDRAKTIADNNSKTISCPAIAYMQGEYNYINLAGQGLTPGTDATNDKDTFKAYLLTLKNNMQAKVMAAYNQVEKPIFLLYQVSGSYINLDNMSINMAMLEFAEENDDVILMNPTHQCPDYGGGHLSTNGYRWYANYIAKQLYNTLIKGNASHTVFARDIRMGYDKKTVIINCEVPAPPLVFDTYTTPSQTYYGFQVKDDTGEITISSVEILDGTAIKLNLSRDIEANAFVSYAGRNRNGSGNVRDSEKWLSIYDYADETSLRKPTYTPKDAEGSNLYGKKYPMQNWLIGFFKELN